jgi:hypothetical protein
VTAVAAMVAEATEATAVLVAVAAAAAVVDTCYHQSHHGHPNTGRQPSRRRYTGECTEVFRLWRLLL